MSYSITRAAPADIPDLADMRVAFQCEAGAVVGDGSLMRSQVKDYLDVELDRAVIAFLAREDESGDAVASAFLVIVHRLPGGRHGNGWMGMVLNVYTKPAHRRRGIARRLMTSLVDAARQMGLARVELVATADGVSLYEQAGFRVDSSAHVPMELLLAPVTPPVS